MELETTKHNPGGRHAKYRAVRAWLNWYEREVKPEAWTNPIAKVKPQKIAHEPIDPVPVLLFSIDNLFKSEDDKR